MSAFTLNLLKRHSRVSPVMEISLKGIFGLNLEPVYGIVLSFVFFGDMNKMTLGFWVGATIILSAILLFPVVQKQVYKKN